MPALFIGHGSPMNLVLKNGFTESLASLGRTLPKPRAIMVVSAHWLTNGATYVDCQDQPGTIHDFHGFPEALYKIDYPASGSPEDARSVTRMVKRTHVKCHTDWGLDHASWAVLRHMYPRADIPVFEMSLDYSFNDWSPKPLLYHYELARELAGLRDNGVLVIGSGNIVHNLSLIEPDIDSPPYDWAAEFDRLVKQKLLENDHMALVDYEKLCKGAALAVPTLDHYLPMLYTVALREPDDELRFVYEGSQYASVSMRSFQIG
jgi:4,5-DOPA dioxygenase extradiol